MSSEWVLETGAKHRNNRGVHSRPFGLNLGPISRSTKFIILIEHRIQMSTSVYELLAAKMSNRNSDAAEIHEIPRVAELKSNLGSIWTIKINRNSVRNQAHIQPKWSTVLSPNATTAANIFDPSSIQIFFSSGDIYNICNQYLNSLFRGSFLFFSPPHLLLLSLLSRYTPGLTPWRSLNAQSVRLHPRPPAMADHLSFMLHVLELGLKILVKCVARLTTFSAMSY